MFKKRKVEKPDYEEIHRLEDELGFSHLEPEVSPQKTLSRGDLLKGAAIVAVAPPVLLQRNVGPKAEPAVPAKPKLPAATFEESFELTPGARWPVMASSAVYMASAASYNFTQIERAAFYGNQGAKLRVVKGYRSKS